MNLALDNLSVRPPLVRIVFLGEPMNLLSIPARARIGTGREFAYRSRVFRALRFNSLSHYEDKGPCKGPSYTMGILDLECRRHNSS